MYPFIFKISLDNFIKLHSNRYIILSEVNNMDSYRDLQPSYFNIIVVVHNDAVKI